MRALALLLVLAACTRAEIEKSPAPERAERRAYDGAPPVIPHDAFEAACTSCHGERAVEVAGVGLAPPSPHARADGSFARCEQCHVRPNTETIFAGSTFHGLRQDLRHGRRLHVLAPPVMPHPAFMRENCRACHTGPAAREEIRTSHPERDRCRQCHVERVTDERFARS